MDEDAEARSTAQLPRLVRMGSIAAAWVLVVSLFYLPLPITAAGTAQADSAPSAAKESSTLFVSMPAVEGLAQLQAEQALAGAGLQAPRLRNDFSGKAARGIIVEQEPPAGANVQLDAQTALAVSKGFLPAVIIVAVAGLLLLSAFFSSSETAFFSIHKLRLRSLGEEKNLTGPVIAQMMANPGRLLTTILLGNMIVNVLIGIALGTRLEDMLRLGAGMPVPAAYALAVVAGTAILLIFGEVSPKVLAVYAGERLARVTALPLRMADRLLAPIRDGVLAITNALFAITRFHEFRAAPFITDEELKSVLTNGEAQGVIEEDERQMIQGILEFSDVVLREILVPRPDIIAVQEEATVREALALYREYEYSRMPIYRENLDHITGLLVAKDLMPYFAKGDLDCGVGALARPVHFVPETTTVQQFVKDAQRHRAHLAVVADEYGGTAGIVTLEDALEQVVGNIMDPDEQEEESVITLEPNVYQVDGRLSLHELNEAIGTNLTDEEHETIAGYVIHQMDKLPEPGDQVEHDGIRLTVEAVEGKRVLWLRLEKLPSMPENGKEEEA